MATQKYRHALAIHAAPEVILSALSHYEFFLEHGIHPNAIEVRFLGERAGADSVMRRHYRNCERVRLGPLWLTVSHRATNYIAADGALVGEAFQFRGST